MYSLSTSVARSLESASIMDQKSLVEQMKEDGLAIKKQYLNNTGTANYDYIPNEEENSAVSFIKSLSKKQKKALLKKLEKLEKGAKKEKKRRDSSSSEEDRRRDRKKHSRNDDDDDRRNKKRKSDSSDYENRKKRLS